MLLPSLLPVHSQYGTAEGMSSKDMGAPWAPGLQGSAILRLCTLRQTFANYGFFIMTMKRDLWFSSSLLNGC